MEFPDYGTNSGVVVYWGDNHISTFLDNTILIAIATAEQFRDWIGNYSFWNSEESFRNPFLTKISEKDEKQRRSLGGLL